MWRCSRTLGGAVLVGALACASRTPAPARWTYELDPAADGSQVEVTARFAGFTGATLVLPAGAADAHDVTLASGAALVQERASWRLPAATPTAAADRGVTIRYRVDLRRRLAPGGNAAAIRLASLLLRPPGHIAGIPVQLGIATAAASRFASGLTPPPTGAGSLAFDSAILAELPWAAVGTLRHRTVTATGGRIDIAFLPGELNVDDDTITTWVGDTAHAVADYYGSFPVPYALVVVRPGPGRGAGDAVTRGLGGASTLLPLGRWTTARTLAHDWVLTHEFVHYALPNLSPNHRWLEEGLATYLEPIIRTRAGRKRVNDTWRGWIRNMRMAAARPGDGGLDHASGWAATYWRGAAFCLLADVAIRSRTGNRHSLRTAVRAIQAAGGSIGVMWNFEHVVQVADTATGVPVFAELYAQLGEQQGDANLNATWAKLGVALRGRRVVFDDNAPLAHLRAALVRGE